ncbi:MAG TPA: TIGR04282 family arsenosugar biosynthesis glycosyltransferase [Candidatus Brocadiaceae bacterium]
MDNALIIFLKYPEPGRVKTRLAKAIGNEKACLIYKQLAEKVITKICQKNGEPYDIYVFFTPADKQHAIKTWLTPVFDKNGGVDVYYKSQSGDSLGERMSLAFREILQERQHKKGIIVGADCPEIDASLIEDAFEVLREKDVVIGPAHDGGYYLFGMSKYIQDLFADIDWSTDRVFRQTMEKVYKNNLSCTILTTLRDIDTWEDFCAYFGSSFLSF